MLAWFVVGWELLGFMASHEEDDESPHFSIFGWFYHLGSLCVLYVLKSRFCEGPAQSRSGEAEVEYACIVVMELAFVQIQVSNTQMTGRSRDFVELGH